jgi:phosphohistidine phosphatase
MRICFLRHGEADWPGWHGPDDERPLTDDGRQEVNRVGTFLARVKLSPDAILTSPLPRALQTAEIVAEHLGVAPKIEPALAENFDLKRLRRMMSEANARRIMLVGHEPSFSNVIGELTGGRVKLRKAGVALVETDESCSSGVLHWLFPPKIAKTHV